jgi:hypothetical protein
MFRTIAVCLLFALPAKAAVVVVINNSDRDQTFAVQHATKGPASSVSLKSGDFRILPVGKNTELQATLNDQMRYFRLDAYSAYVFVREREGKYSFQGIQLAAPLPKADDLPDQPSEAKPLVVSVKIYADDAEKRLRVVWEKALRTRFEAAAEIVAAQTGVQFKFADAGEWKSDPVTKSFAELLAGFETAAPVKGNELHLVFTGRATKKNAELGLTPTPFAGHVLVNEGQPKTESERIEVLAHHLGQYLGAVRSADTYSIMRVNLRDGGAARAKHRAIFDPLNILAMHIWVAEANAGGRRKLEELRPPARERLYALYKTQAALHELAKSKDTQAKEYALALEPAGQGGEAVPKEPASKLTPQQQAIRAVVKAIVSRAEENSKLPANDPKKLSQDALTGEYLRVAAEVAAGLDEKYRTDAFLIGTGIALDHSPLLRTNLLTRGVCAPIESEDETKARLAVLGSPTIRDRRDLCQHYVVSMALTAMLGAEGAEIAGMTKELLDMKGTSGFSFIDLTADYAGVELAKRIIKEPARFKAYAKGFQFDQHFPDLKGLREGFNEEQFKKEFRSTSDAKFKAVIDDIRSRIAKLEAFK